MSFLSLFKKDNANKAPPQKPHPEVVTTNITGTSQNPALPSDPFAGGFVQFKTKPAATGAQPNPFSPATISPATQPASGASLYGATSQIKIDYSGLSPIDPTSGTFLSSDGDSLDINSQGDCNTPNNGNNGIRESPVKKSAFGFIKKTPTGPPKTESNENDQNDLLGMNSTPKNNNPFQNNTLSGGLRIAEAQKGNQVNQDLLSLDFKKNSPSAASQANEATKTGSQQTGGFPLTFKAKQPTQKETVPVTETSNNRRPSIDITSSTQRKPSGIEPAPQNEKTESLVKPEAPSETVTETKKGGPSFMKFKQKTTKVDEAKDSTPSSRNELSVKSEFVSSGKKKEVEPVSTDNIDQGEKADSPVSDANDKSHPNYKPVPVPTVNNQESPDALQTRIDAEKNALMEKIGNLTLKQNKIIANKESLESQKEQILKKLKDLGRQQNRAIENDNFEEADQLEALIVQTNQKIKGFDQEIDNCQLQHANIEKEKNGLYQQSLSIYRNYLVNVEKAMLGRNHVFEKYKLDCLNQQNVERFYIEEESQRLQLHRNHLDLDLKHIQEESSGLEKNIEKQTKDYVQSQMDLSARKIDLELEIEQIRKLLQERESELVSVTSALDKVTNKINGVRNKFSDHLNRIQAKRDKSEQGENQYAKDLEKLNQFKSNAENNLKIYNDTISEHQKVMQTHEALKSEWQNKLESLREENTARESALQAYYNSLTNLKEVKSQLAQRAGDIEDLKEGLHKIQKEMADIGAQKIILEAKIPELEAEKKTFINSRSFKDASRVSNDIKDIQTKIQELDHKLTELASKDKLQAQKISALEKNTLPQLTSKVESALKICDLDKFHYLQSREGDLSAIVDYFSKKKQHQEAKLMETELNEVQYQIRELKIKYPELIHGAQESQEPEDHHEPEARHEELAETQEHHYEHEEEETGPAYQEHAGYYQDVEHEGGVYDHEEQREEAHGQEQVDLPECIAEYDELAQRISELDAQIEQLAEEEKFEEADELSNQQNQLKQRQEILLRNIQSMGFGDVEEARGSL